MLILPRQAKSLQAMQGLLFSLWHSVLKFGSNPNQCTQRLGSHEHCLKLEVLTYANQPGKVGIINATKVYNWGQCALGLFLFWPHINGRLLGLLK